MSSSAPTIPEWFAKRKVLITGVTGFMGKVLLVKLLTSCPDIDSIFLLIRERKGVNPQSRLRTLLQQEPFKELREKHPERLKKIEAIGADVTIAGLALSEADKARIIDNVSVVFHVAANVRFDMPLKTAVQTNTGGAANVVAFAKQISQLESYIHVSTSYCQCGEEVLEERYYPAWMSPEDMLSVVDKMDDSTLEGLTPKVLREQPNTYAFSKALGEDIVARSGLPAGVARPSIVIASWKEPMPGWVENMNGPTGLMVGAGKGVIRSMLCNAEYATHVIPCDNAVNATIVLAWKVGLEKPKKPIFMNVAGSKENPVTWGQAIDTGRKHICEYPFSGPLWYPGGGITSSKLWHSFAVIFFQIIPAFLLDGLLYVTGYKPFLMRIQSKVAVGIEMLQYYTMKDWKFRSEGMENLEKELSPSDREVFFMNTKEINWDDYMRTYIIGARNYCLKEDPSTLPRARRVFKYLYVADLLLKIIFGLCVAWFLYLWLMPLKVVRQSLVM